MRERRVRRTREEQREETRRRLVDAAKKTFVRRGYEATSVEEIAEAAGYTRGAVYSNFRDKDELYVTVLEACMNEKLAEVGAIVAHCSTVAERIAALRTFFTEDDDHHSAILYAELQLAAARHPDLRRKLRTMFERHLENTLLVVVGRALPVDTFRTIFTTMFAVIEGIALQRASGNATPEVGRAARQIVYDAVCPLLEAYATPVIPSLSRDSR
jgi:AcrR family transcriptional regulator